jgi:peptidyl-prolyl cis-trans isomerase SurA
MRDMRLSRTFLLVLSLLAATIAIPTRAVMLDGYAALVGDQVITVGEVKEQMQRRNREVFIALQAGERVADEKLERLYSEALDELIAEALVLEEYRLLEEDGKVAIPEDAVDNTIQNIIKERYGDRRADFFGDLERSGITFNEFKEQQLRNIILMVMRNNQFPDPVVIAPGAVRELYDTRRADFSQSARCELALIMIDAEADDGEQEDPRKLAERLATELAAGADFAALAREHSEGAKADAGGYRGWMELGDLRQELRAAIEQMKPGQTSGPILSGGKYYIVKLIDFQPARVKSLSEVEDELSAELRRAAMDARMDAWVSELKKKHYVNRLPLPDTL